MAKSILQFALLVTFDSIDIAQTNTGPRESNT